jgi:hypothetical protein
MSHTGAPALATDRMMMIMMMMMMRRRRRRRMVVPIVILKSVPKSPHQFLMLKGSVPVNATTTELLGES